jgi:hypothetical protein
MRHILFFQFSCGHEYFDTRRTACVSDLAVCLCESCHPYHAAVIVEHPCRICNGSFLYPVNVLQTKLSNEDAERRMEKSPLHVPFT